MAGGNTGDGVFFIDIQPDAAIIRLQRAEDLGDITWQRVDAGATALVMGEFKTTPPVRTE